jgi:hypothetical protein
MSDDHIPGLVYWQSAALPFGAQTPQQGGAVNLGPPQNTAPTDILFIRYQSAFKPGEVEYAKEAVEFQDLVNRVTSIMLRPDPNSVADAIMRALIEQFPDRKSIAASQFVFIAYEPPVMPDAVGAS